jgi:2-polyprenyl-3-methyl-5-hydroxy-6-metoxy-1,4-benzoquinol methylase
MSDFRKVLYERYVSNFKGAQSRWSDAELASYFAWSERKFGPALEGLAKDARIVELGCGPGYMLEFLGRKGFRQVSGIDISAEQVALAKARGCDASVNDVFRHLEEGRESYDAIMALDFIEHFHKDELMTLMPALFGALRKGGRLILQTPNGEGLFPRQVIYGDLTHLTVLTPSSMSQLLASFGFTRVRYHETGPAAVGLKGLARVAAWKVLRAAANLVRRIETGKSQAVWTENMICVSERPA